MHMSNNLLQRSTPFSSTDQSWEQAAEIQISRIFSREAGSDLDRMHGIPHLIQLRSYLDVMIAELQDVPAGKIAEMFIQLGRIARALGNNSEFLNSRYFLEHAELLNVIIRKQRDYGHENIARFGRTGLLVRLHDKVARLENLLGSGNVPNNESIEDNIGDVIGYCTIGAMWEEGTFLLALQGNTVAESAKAAL